MKKKLAGQIAVASQRHVPWPQVLGAAALLVVIIGVGVLFRWREPAQERDLTFSDTTVSDALLKNMPTAPAPTTGTGKVSADQQLTPLPRDDREGARRDKKDVAAVDRQIRIQPSDMRRESERSPASTR